MKKGDIVVCIVHSTPIISHKDYWSGAGISYGKQYEVLGTLKQYYDNFITISNDHGIISDYKVSKFVTLSEWREEKLNELGI